MGGRGASMAGKHGSGVKNSPEYKSAYSGEINNTNYSYLSFEAAAKSSNDSEMQKKIMASEMKAHQDVIGEPALKTMNRELAGIKRAIKENHQLAVDYGIPKNAELGIRDALREHQSRIEKVIDTMNSSRLEYEKLTQQLKENKKSKGKWRL